MFRTASPKLFRFIFLIVSYLFRIRGKNALRPTRPNARLGSFSLLKLNNNELQLMSINLDDESPFGPKAGMPGLYETGLSCSSRFPLHSLVNRTNLQMAALHTVQGLEDQVGLMNN